MNGQAQVGAKNTERDIPKNENQHWFPIHLPLPLRMYKERIILIFKGRGGIRPTKTILRGGARGGGATANVSVAGVRGARGGARGGVTLARGGPAARLLTARGGAPGRLVNY